MTETSKIPDSIDKSVSYDAVFYTDGGCVPNPGNAGHGIHGYFFVSESDPEFKEAKKPEVITNHFVRRPEGVLRQDYGSPTVEGYKDYVPGSDLPAKPVNVALYVDHSYSFFEPVTNNVAELSGAIHALSILLQALETGLKVKKVKLLIDSQYTLKTLTVFGDAYRKNGWVTSMGEPAKNKDRIELMLDQRDRLVAAGVELEACWVRGHQDDIGNGMADYLATIAVRRSRAMDNPNQVRWSLPKDYWDSKTDMHPFLTFRRSFFNRVSAFNTPGHYFMIEPASEDLMLGKRDHEAYAVIRLKEPNIYLEAIREAQSRFGQHENKIIVDRMDRVTNKMIQKFIREHGSYCLGPSVNQNGVVFLDKAPVSMEHSPAALFYRVLDAFGVITERLEQFIEITGGTDQDPQETDKVDGLIVHDVTNDFYTVEEKKNPKLGIVKKKVLKPEFVVGYKNHILSVEESRDGNTATRKFPMALGMDLPNRNALKQLEDHNPNIYLVTWKSSPDVLQYAFVIDCLSGIGMWSNYFCDRLFLKNG